jgi:hypothetical protein
MHRVYLVLDTPQSPMAIPWTEVLEDACGFARYRSTASEVARYCTTGLFFAQRFYYPGDYRSHWTSEYPYWMRFKLTQYYNTPGWVAGNCVDVSDFLCICLLALGLDFVVAQFRNNLSTPSMVTNPICLIGSDPTQDSSYQSLPNPFNPPFDKPWGMHQFALSPWGGAVYDVCAAQKFDLLGNSYRNPPFDWNLYGFWQTAPNLGLVYSPTGSMPVLSEGPYTPTVQ